MLNEIRDKNELKSLNQNFKEDIFGIIICKYGEKPLEKILNRVKNSNTPVFCKVLKSKFDHNIKYRQFVAGSWGSIRIYYSNIIYKMMVSKFVEEELTLMEVIKENYPCRFYIDAESLITEKNEDQDWVVTMENIINFIKLYFVEYFDFPSNYEIEYLILDSTSKKKFSKHITFYVFKRDDDHKQELLFENNECFKFFLMYSFGNFSEKLNELLSKKNKTQNKEDMDYEIVKNYFELVDKHGRIYKFENQGYGLEAILKNGTSDENIIDMNVYTKNRNFRFPLSTKIGEKRPLIPEFCSIDEIKPIINEKRKIIPLDGSFFCEWKHYIQAKILDSFNQDFLFKIGPICLFDGWEKCPIIKSRNSEHQKIYPEYNKKTKIEKDKRSNGKSLVDFKVENNEKNKNFNIQKRELFDFNANFIPHEDLSNCFTEIFELIKKEIEFLPNSDVELIPYFENSKKLKIYYNHNNIFFSTQNKRCKIALRKHNSNNVNTIISIYTLDVFQRCLDADCEKKKDNGVDFICCLKDLLSESLLSKINEIIAKIYYESKAKLNEEQEIKYLELYNNILDNFF